MKVVQITLTTRWNVLMEVRDDAEAREIARIRWQREIVAADEYEVDISDSPVDRNDPRVEKE